MTTSFTDSFLPTEDLSSQVNNFERDCSSVDCDGIQDSIASQTIHRHTSVYSGHADETGQTKEARGAPDFSDTKQESSSQRQARWKDKESLYPKCPLYNITAGDRRSGIPAKIKVKGKVIDQWLNRIDLFLCYRNRKDEDGLALQLNKILVSLADMFPMTPAQAASRETMDFTDHPVKRLFKDVALTLWSFALDPIQEYNGAKQEVDRMCVESVVIWPGGYAGNPMPPASSSSAASGDGEREIAETLLLLARGSCFRSEAENSRIESRVLSNVPERTTSSISFEPGDAISTASLDKASGCQATPMSFPTWDNSRACRSIHAKWTAREQMAEGSPLYKVLPKYMREGGTEIKGKCSDYWMDLILQRCKGNDPAQLVPWFTVLLDTLKDPRRYTRDRAGWPEAPSSGALKERRRGFARDVALALWIVASDCEKEYSAVAAYLGWLNERAFSHVGLRIPEVSSYRSVAAESGFSSTSARVACTDHEELGRSA